MATTLLETDEIKTDFGIIKFTAERIQDREMLEELSKLVQKHGVDLTTAALKTLNEK